MKKIKYKICEKKIITPYKCEICENEFKTLRGLKTHISQFHKSEIIKKFKCEICEHEFETLNGLKIHISQFHKSEIIKKFKCEICEHEFINIKALAIHIVKVHKIKSEEYYLKFIGEKGKCVECGKDTRFNNLRVGYIKFCSNKCSSNNFENLERRKETILKNNNNSYHDLTMSEYQEIYPDMVKCEICGKICLNF